MIHSPLLDATRSDFSDDVVASIKQYQRSDLKRSLFQVTTTIGALLTCCVMIYAGVSHGWWAALVLTPLAAGLSIRTFVLQHDCGHGSLFKKQWLNDLTGRICSLLTLTPYDHWRRHHALHHGS